MNTPPDGPEASKDSPRPRPNIPGYELLHPIGRGSYGEVWLALDDSKTFRAVKLVSRSTFESDRPFERELNGIKKFGPISRHHPSQVAIFEVGRGDGYFYYAMELADNVAPSSQDWANGKRPNPDSTQPEDYAPATLKHAMRDRRRLPVEECVRIGLALTTALENLHGHGLVHRDIKPSNIIFVDGVPKLADIGLVTDSDATLTHVGTEGFLPPEGPGKPAADLYGLGKVLYELSSGKDRFDYPESPAELGTFPDRSNYLELEEVIEKACHPDIRQRYVAATEMRLDLELLQRGGSVKRRRRGQSARRMLLRAAQILMLGVVSMATITLWNHRTPTRESPSEPLGTESQAAIKEWRLGKFYLSKRTPAGLNEALERFETAISLDPSFARAYAGKADCYNLLDLYTNVSPDISRPQAREAALKALALDDTLAEAHIALAVYKRSYERDWAGSERAFKRGLELDPNYASAHHWYSILLSSLGRHEESIAEARLAIELEPASLILNDSLASRYYFNGSYEDAIKQYLHTIAMDPYFRPARAEITWVYESMGRFTEALDAREEYCRLVGLTCEHLAQIRQAFERSGPVGYWQESRNHQEQQNPSGLNLARILSMLGNAPAALTVLEQAYERRSSGLANLVIDPAYKNLHQEKRFLALRQKLNL